MEPKWRPDGAKMPPKIDPENQIKGTPSQDPSKGGFWMDLGSILGGFWRDLRALAVQMAMKIDTFRRKFRSFP